MADAQIPESDEPAGRDRHPHRTALVLLLAFFVAVTVVVVAGARYYGHCRSPSGPKTPVTVVVPSGASGSQTVEILHAKGVIPCGGFIGRTLLEGTGKASDIRAGSFDLTTNMTVAEAATVLSTAPVEKPTVELTIIPGWRATRIALAVQQDLGIAQNAFMAVATSGKFSLPPYLPKGKSLEGFLWPQTYQFQRKGLTPTIVIQRVLEQFKTDTASFPWANTKALGISPYQAVIIASMIEKEVMDPADRKLVAAVIYNRLKNNMLLGFDTTVAYIDPDPSNGLTASDFQIKSPYNTRINYGLPPGPIASPGKESLLAALTPATSPFKYFLQCPGEARLRFSTSYAAFLQDKTCLG
jgi:peptidoglycan lytic transglycosylase G